MQESGELKKSCDILGYCRTKCNFYESDNFMSASSRNHQKTMETEVCNPSVKGE